MQTTRRNIFTTIRTEGAILPADLLQRIAEGDGKIDGVTPQAYHLFGNEKLNEAINRSWNRMLGAWIAFQTALTKITAEDPATTATRERWLLPLFQELGYGRLVMAKATEIEGKSYPISHFWDKTPIHLVGCRIDLDRRTAGVAGAAHTSPHSLVQEFLNRSDDHLWAFVVNGYKLRILRDNVSLTRQAYVEFDLQTMMEGEVYSDFVLLWLLVHQSRVEGERPEQCWLEQWSQTAQAQGTRALEHLRHGVTEAITALGRGFLSFPENIALRQKLETGTLTTQEYYRQLLRQVYRLIFLFVAEDRELLLDPQASPEAKNRYIRYYSTTRLRRLAERRKGSDHADLWHGLRLVFEKLGDDQGCPELGLPPLGSFLWSIKGVSNLDLTAKSEISPKESALRADATSRFSTPGSASPTATSKLSTPDLDNLDISNHDLLDAIRALAFTIDRNVRRAVDYKNLGSEELGSVYESLLEYHPIVNTSAGTFALEVAAGNERKTTGSHYTPTQLITCLLDSALDPVIEETIQASRQDASRQAAKSAKKKEKELSAFASLRETQEKELSASASLREAEEALLNLKICDPACGSGHFLIAAAHRLAKRLAALRTGDDEPPPEATRSALRDVVGRCLYGVDLNPMAVELCKFSLWLEALEPGKPLSFLDHHIKCGNSLLGTTPALLKEGIPDNAFKSIERDDKKICQTFKKENKAQRGGQFSLFTYDDQPWNKLGNLAQSMVDLRVLEDGTIWQVREKQAQYETVVRSTGYLFGKLWADAWCAAFVWKKDQDHSPPLTEEVFRKIERTPYGVSKSVQEEIQWLSQEYQFFHWHLEFPDVFRVLPEEDTSRQDAKTAKKKEQHEENLGAFASWREDMGWEGGFDVVLGNPPWERIKLQEKEWFAPRHPDIANAPNAAKRRKMIKALTADDPALYNAFLDARREAEGQSHFVRDAGHYPLCGRGDVNTYTIFSELNRQVLSNTGRVGCIVPSGIATDDTTKFFFQDLMESHSLASLFDFENRKGIFPAVHRSFKFCLLTLCGLQSPTQQGADFVFFALNAEHLRDKDRHFALSAEDIALLNPNSKTCPIFRGKRDAELTKAIYQRIPVLMNDESSEENYWGIKFSTMFHMANDSHLFRTREQLEGEDCQLEGNVFVREEQQFLPLYEAKMIHQFDHRAADVSISATAQVRQGQPQLIDYSGHVNPELSAIPRYWVEKASIFERLDDYNLHGLLGFADVTSSTNERTMLTTLLPIVGVGHTMPLIFTTQPADYLLGLLANLNSFVFDYLGRQKVGGLHYTYFILKQLPIILPPSYDERIPWKSAEMFLDWIDSRILELTYTAWDLEAFAKDCGYDGPPFRWDEERRFLLRCELDAAYFHLYDIEHDDVDYIMDTFPIVKRKDEAKHGEYRIKRVILEIYDEMQECKNDTGVSNLDLTAKSSISPEGSALRADAKSRFSTPTSFLHSYQTRLDPPPADPRVAHPERKEDSFLENVNKKVVR